MILFVESSPSGPPSKRRSRGDPPSTWVELDRHNVPTGTLVLAHQAPRDREDHYWVAITATNADLLGAVFFRR